MSSSRIITGKAAGLASLVTDITSGLMAFIKSGCCWIMEKKKLPYKVAIIPDTAPAPRKEGKVIYGKFRRSG